MFSRTARFLALSTPLLLFTAAPGPKIADPVAPMACNKYNDPILAECNAFVAFRGAVERGDWYNAERFKAKSGRFLTADFGVALVTEMEAKMAAEQGAAVSAVTPDAFDAAKVTAVAIAMKSDTPVCAGEGRLFVVTSTLADGTTKATWTEADQKGGHFDPSAFVLTSPAGKFELDKGDGRWTFYAAANPLLGIDGYPLQVAVKDRPEVKGAGLAASTLECMKGLYLTGMPGSRGLSNANGGNGAAAGEATVDVGLVATKAYPKLLVMKGVTPLGTWWYAGPFDPSRKIEVSNAGGAGGAGAYNTDGWGFNGGNGGDGGKLVVRYDKRHPELAAAIAASSPAGLGGTGGGGSPGPGSNGNSGRPGPEPAVTATDPTSLFVGDGVTLK